jgi:hypothetical protein
MFNEAATLAFNGRGDTGKKLPPPPPHKTLDSRKYKFRGDGPGITNCWHQQILWLARVICIQIFQWIQFLALKFITHKQSLKSEPPSQQYEPWGAGGGGGETDKPNTLSAFIAVFRITQNDVGCGQWSRRGVGPPYRTAVRYDVKDNPCITPASWVISTRKFRKSLLFLHPKKDETFRSVANCSPSYVGPCQDGKAQPPGLESSREYTDKAVVDSRQGVVLHLGDHTGC